jgi:hypothetical protein
MLTEKIMAKETLRQKLIGEFRHALHLLESENEESIIFNFHETDYCFQQEDLDAEHKPIFINLD